MEIRLIILSARCGSLVVLSHLSTGCQIMVGSFILALHQMDFQKIMQRTSHTNITLSASYTMVYT